MAAERNDTMNNMKSKEFGTWTLADVLSEGLFLVPNYQRGYAWTERQLNEFWEDINIAVLSNRRHYTGAITVEKDDAAIGNSKRPYYEVIDGQQRLTTAAILLSVFKKGDSPFLTDESAGEKKLLLSYAENNEDRQFLENILLDRECDDALNSYQRNLKGAKKFFEKKLEEIDTTQTEAIVNAVMTKLAFDFRILEDDFDSGVVFETMNNRGKALTLLEKLKNRLMYLTNGLEEDDDEKDELCQYINEGWGEIYRHLASNPNIDPLDENEFVAAHLSVCRNPKERVYSEAVAESRLFKMFCSRSESYPKSEGVDVHDGKAMERAKREEKISLEKIRDYVKDLRKFSEPWAKVHGDFENAMGRCRLISGTREVKVFLAAVLRKVESEDIRTSIFDMAEKILFRNTIKTVLDEATFVTLARRLHGKCLDMLRGLEREPVTGEGILEGLKAKAMDERHQIDVERFIDRFADGFYGWSGLKYFLFKEEGANGLPWSKFEETSIEHIIPQSSVQGDDGWWTRQVREFAPYEGVWSDLEREEKRKCKQRRHVLVNSLGNFVLLTQSENASVSNDPWEGYPEVEGRHRAVIGKKAFYADVKNDSSAGARAVAQNFECWNAFCVRDRGRKLFKKLGDMILDESASLSDDQIDEALGFVNIQNLQNTKFGALSEDEVNRLAPRMGTGAESEKRKGNDSVINGERENAMTSQQLDEVLQMFNNAGILLEKSRDYVPYPTRSADLVLCRRNSEPNNFLYLKEETPYIGFYGNDYEVMRSWATAVLQDQIKKTKAFKDWAFKVPARSAKGSYAVWFTLKLNREPWYDRREEVVSVAAELYKILKDNGALDDNFDVNRYK